MRSEKDNNLQNTTREITINGGTMDTKVMSFTNTAVQEVGNVSGYIDIDNKREYKVLEDYKTTALRLTKNTNVFVKNINLFLKRIIDIIGSIVGIILLVPITIAVYIANKIEKDNGPLFYCHTRIGKDGKYFKMYKFRSMVVDADEKLKYLLENDEEARKEWEANQKLQNDPRVTKIGNFLRKTSLDEFPQFINVLKGDMSIVGPRAVVDGEIEKFGIYQKEILSVKPGITGYWAANGRSCTNYDERVFMEYTYIRNFSIFMDIKILFKTIITVLKKEGAV